MDPYPLHWCCIQAVEELHRHPLKISVFYVHTSTWSNTFQASVGISQRPQRDLLFLNTRPFHPVVLTPIFIRWKQTILQFWHPAGSWAVCAAGWSLVCLSLLVIPTWGLALDPLSRTHQCLYSYYLPLTPLLSQLRETFPRRSRKRER